MREHRDASGQLCAVTLTRSEWRSRRQLRDHGRAYVWPTPDADAPVRAIVVADGSPEARPAPTDGNR